MRPDYSDAQAWKVRCEARMEGEKLASSSSGDAGAAGGEGAAADGTAPGEGAGAIDATPAAQPVPAN